MKRCHFITLFCIAVFTIALPAQQATRTATRHNTYLAPWLEQHGNGDFVRESDASEWIMPELFNALAPEKVININADSFNQAQQALEQTSWGTAKTTLAKITYQTKHHTKLVVVAGKPDTLETFFSAFNTGQSWEERDNFEFMLCINLPNDETAPVIFDQVYIDPDYRSRNLGVQFVGRQTMKLVFDHLADNGFAGRPISAYCVNPKTLEYMRTFCNADIDFDNFFLYPHSASQWMFYLKEYNLIPQFSRIDSLLTLHKNSLSAVDPGLTKQMLGNSLYGIMMQHLPESDFDGKNLIDYILAKLASSPTAFCSYNEYIDQYDFLGITAIGTLIPSLTKTQSLELEQAC